MDNGLHRLENLFREICLKCRDEIRDLVARIWLEINRSHGHFQSTLNTHSIQTIQFGTAKKFAEICEYLEHLLPSLCLRSSNGCQDRPESGPPLVLSRHNSYAITGKNH
jgi:hypothetical protein